MLAIVLLSIAVVSIVAFGVLDESALRRRRPRRSDIVVSYNHEEDTLTARRRGTVDERRLEYGLIAFLCDHDDVLVGVQLLYGLARVDWDRDPYGHLVPAEWRAALEDYRLARVLDRVDALTPSDHPQRGA